MLQIWCCSLLKHHVAMPCNIKAPAKFKIYDWMLQCIATWCFSRLQHDVSVYCNIMCLSINIIIPFRLSRTTSTSGLSLPKPISRLSLQRLSTSSRRASGLRGYGCSSRGQDWWGEKTAGWACRGSKEGVLHLSFVGVNSRIASAMISRHLGHIQW